MPLETIKEIGRVSGCTVNDVLLAICGGALRRYLLAHDGLPRASLVAGMPVSLKSGDADTGNKLSYIMSPFFTNEADDRKRLHRVIKVSCVAARDYMTADASKVLIFGVDLAKKTWDLASSNLNRWSDAQIDAYMPHQVSRRNMDVLNEKLGLTPEKHHLNFPTLGNIGPAAVPITLSQAAESGRIGSGHHVALMGIGSGLNCLMLGLEW